MPDEPIAAPSVAAEAVEAPPEPIAVEDFTPEQRQEWLKTGKEPEPASKKAETPKKESSELPSAEQPAAEAKPAPASEPAKEQEPAIAPGEKRKGQLANEIQQLLKQRAELRQETERILAERAKASPAAPAESTETSSLKKPKVDDFSTWEEYETAKDQYYEKLAESKATAAVEKDRQERATAAQVEAIQKQNHEIENAWSKRTREFIASHPEAKDFEAAVGAMANSELIPENSFLDQWVLNSDQGPALAWYFSQNPDEILRVGELHPINAARELAKLENSFESKAPANGASPGVPVIHQQKAAPKPPATVSARAAAPADEIEAALNSDDARGYIEAMNRKELVARKG